jgi:hypothetical protein
MKYMENRTRYTTMYFMIYIYQLLLLEQCNQKSAGRLAQRWKPRGTIIFGKSVRMQPLETLRRVDIRETGSTQAVPNSNSLDSWD